MANYSNAHICHCMSRLSTLRRNSHLTISGNRRQTGPEFVDGVLALAQGLLRLGLGCGDVVAIAAFNSEWHLEWLLAVAYVGGIAAPLNYRWGFEEAMLAMEMVNPVLLVMDKSCNHWFPKLWNYDLASLRWRVSLEEEKNSIGTWNFLSMEAIKKGFARDLPLSYSWAPEGTVLICFTSGTTGKPKGVTISHSALIVQSLAKIAIVGYSEDDVYLHTAPLCHIGGLSSAFAMLMTGACHVLIPKFDAKSAIEAIEKHGVTSLITVPAIMADLISAPRGKEIWKGRNSIKKILNGGGGLSTKLIRDAAQFFPRAKLLSAYGMTETCSSLTFMTLYDPKLEIPIQPLETSDGRKPTSVHPPQGVCVGKPAPHVELKIYVEGSSRIGRILTRGPHVMLRYWDQSPSDASDSSNKDWLDTGDIGYIDDYGNLRLIGRTNGRIKSGGENVYPEEVESILSQHPGVMGIVVVGIPDARLTEMVVACIQLRNDWQWSHRSSLRHSISEERQHLSSDILRQYCKEKNLAGFKIPKILVFWKKSFPLTTTGKIRRDQVREQVMSHLQSFYSNL
ncbi:hypothetical protein FEM48_Zijuj01G0099900 [Ziziphus jujuba var. spinosa]|uniref:2-succinylbenzoate--CoA ligase, chloroplastic/peroxisomal n=1 Tax=Ziziphus jujuba var. spinosa TaxID=714518 RepID=A0A978W0L1_ZIZJJ|nr:hypothetical protein FEM48_Zijuj01G0099900 [Ziziphus jujuba var. spinosa]